MIDACEAETPRIIPEPLSLDVIIIYRIFLYLRSFFTHAHN